MSLIKAGSKVDNRNWVDHKECSLCYRTQGEIYFQPCRELLLCCCYCICCVAVVIVVVIVVVVVLLFYVHGKLLWSCRDDHPFLIRPRGYKTFSMLNSVKHKILNAHKYTKIKKFSIFQAQIRLECYFSYS